ncbi:MAG: hypothetical protein A2186_04460 [Candidatus Levybacteria bacterium RIFOXYA1_FULL_41_10]|nr:MAG: hypothetical protein UT44_C0027G0015 [Candidatus Levybacteria bacterium GW2011_GWA1_39_32]KKR50772.1 MAG: hypothetical protein UT87_C0012G0017 [Candidatus Levybacteria bacterium GW2011_GWC1_40_19]KKR72992.1 MAG: hypothetical protein UU15_C0022G0016 [Candidatus Levybacteria bacterium GW2011_GWC2_40_7]KKR93904.1 MAG: hypothetical protein UU45_C0021G0026 [Candidatus Levybacteria bacterium GW2011_GWA2_41_15]KKS00978.1 MAG: hypothetical protein UU52_C0021G0014 [Candidatus Levybacteria bacter
MAMAEVRPGQKGALRAPDSINKIAPQNDVTSGSSSSSDGSSLVKTGFSVSEPSTFGLDLGTKRLEPDNRFSLNVPQSVTMEVPHIELSAERVDTQIEDIRTLAEVTDAALVDPRVSLGTKAALVAVFVAACGGGNLPTQEPTPVITATPIITEAPTPTVTAEPTPSWTASPEPTATIVVTPSPTSEPTPTVKPVETTPPPELLDINTIISDNPRNISLADLKEKIKAAYEGKTGLPSQDSITLEDFLNAAEGCAAGRDAGNIIDNCYFPIEAIYKDYLASGDIALHGAAKGYYDIGVNAFKESQASIADLNDTLRSVFPPPPSE